MAAERRWLQSPFALLPCDLAALIFKFVPVHSRLRCREVARSWRDALEDHQLWAELDLSRMTGAQLTTALLRAASLRAHGTLRTLDLTGWTMRNVSFEALSEVALANARTLRTLRLSTVKPPLVPYLPLEAYWLRPASIERLLQAAPQLTVFECDVVCDRAEALPLLRNTPPFAALRCCEFSIGNDTDRDGLAELDVPALGAALAAHTSLSGLHLVNVRLSSVPLFDAVVFAAIELQLKRVYFHGCDITPLSLPSLTRLVAAGAVGDLGVIQNPGLFVGDSVVPFCFALRASKLYTINMGNTNFWGSLHDATQIMAALTEHPTVTSVCLSGNPVNRAMGPAVGTMLASLVAGAGAKLECLTLQACGFRDDCLRPLFQAVAVNTTLYRLDCFRNNISAACARDVVLPAVRANTSLRLLKLGWDAPELVEAVEFVYART